MILRPGSKGPEVEQLQADLNAAGHDCGEPDGIYGQRTTEAVLALQGAHGLPADGLFGPQSRAALDGVLQGGTDGGSGQDGSSTGDWPGTPWRADATSSDVADASDDADTSNGGWKGPPWRDDGDSSQDAGGSEGSDASEPSGQDDGWQGPPWADVDDVEDPGHDEDHGESDEPDATDTPAVPGAFPDYFDNWDGELARAHRPDFFLHESSGRHLPFKGRPGPVDLSTRTHVCMHVTAVEFGTSARKRRTWTSRIEGGEISDETLARYDDGTGSVEAMAERMALHERFWPVAYHWVGLLNGDVLFNNAPERYTYHGNRSNAFALGFSAEAKVPARERNRGSSHTVVDEHFIETNRAALRLAITTSRESGAPISHITAHRAFSMTREGDPGEAVWREVALPVARELDVEVDYALVQGGRSIPRDWDPSSPFDWRGNPVD